MKVSASQLHKYRSCHRKIAYEYVLGIKPPTSNKQSFGTAVHAKLEAWLGAGVVPDNSPEGLTAKQGIRDGWLPFPSPELLVEHSFVFPWRGGLDISGFIDVAIPPLLVAPYPVITDHKTTSNLMYAMTVEQLESDPQALLYAIWAMLRWDAVKTEARWIYYSATSPKTGVRRPNGAKLVSTVFDAGSIRFRLALDELNRDLEGVFEIRDKGIEPRSLPPCPESCNAYGGCPFRELCNLEGGEILAAYFRSI